MSSVSNYSLLLIGYGHTTAKKDLAVMLRISVNSYLPRPAAIVVHRAVKFAAGGAALFIAIVVYQ